MKHQLIVLICSLTMVSYSCLGQDYSFEEQVHINVLDSLKSLGYDFESSIHILNQNLGEKGIINEVSEEEFKRLTDAILSCTSYEEGVPTSKLHLISHLELVDSLQDQFLTYARLFNYYAGIMDSSAYEKSRWKSYITDFSEYSDSMERSGDVNFEELARFLSKSISSKDLEHPPYSLSPHLYASAFMDVPTGLQVELPPISDKEKRQKVKRKFVLEVAVDSQDRLSIEDTYQSISGLKEACKEHILKHQAKAIISLKNSRQTSYQAYVNIYNEITAAYNEVRDEYSQRIYRKLYSELTNDQKKEVKLIYPKKLSEAEPVN